MASSTSIAMVGAVAGFSGLVAWWALSPAPRSAYHRAAEADGDSFLTNRKHMLAFFEKDIQKMKTTSLNTVAQAKRDRVVDVRILQWNVNVLMGATGRDPVSPEDVMAQISRTDADVVLLQEAGTQGFQEDLLCGYSKYYQQSVERLNGRIECLHALLRKAGYSIVVADEYSENPALVATRLRVVDPGVSFRVDEGSFANATKGDSRSGRIVRVALPNGDAAGGGSRGHSSQLAVLVTHLHHTEKLASLRGVRAAEVAALLQCWRKSAQPSNPTSPVIATVLASDLNFPRKKDYTSREWAIVRAGFERLGEPLEDGVECALAAAGFRCTYDESGIGAPAFTHWTGTTVDFAWCHFRTPAEWTVLRSEAVPTNISDHLPVVTDLRWVGTNNAYS